MPTPTGKNPVSARWQIVSPSRLRPTLFARRKYWAHRFGVAPVLPMSRAEMEQLGWECCDVILVTGDAYVDHPSFGSALIGRVLEEQGFRVGIIAQPDWHSASAFACLGRPALMFGVTAGNMDSMVNLFTAERRVRSDDAYSPDGKAGLRPERALTVYAQRCREAFPDVPLVIGGIEASLRRVAHYDYWSDKVRRSVLFDSKADLLVYGNGERQVVEIAQRLAAGEPVAAITDVRGTALVLSAKAPRPEQGGESRGKPASFARRVPSREGMGTLPGFPYEINCTAVGGTRAPVGGTRARSGQVIRLPGFEAVSEDPVLYAHASRILHLESNPGNARALVQRHGARDLWVNPPALPLTTAELDAVYDLPFSRRPHPSYDKSPIPAYEMIKCSIAIMRGCFGGCTFCSLTEHEGRIIQSRSPESVLREIESVRDKTPGFTGVISDLGGPTANMYRLACKNPRLQAACRRSSCLYPGICPNLDTDHGPLIDLYQRARQAAGVKKITIGSGVRYDLALVSPAYIEELVKHHVGGYLKVAPEHTEAGPLAKMGKPGIDTFDEFRVLFERFSRQAGKQQYLIPYFLAAHPGTTLRDMVALALWCKRNGFRPDQVQAFLPTPMATATAMYHTGRNPLRPLHRRGGEQVNSARGEKERRLHKAFLRYHDPENWPLLRAALVHLGRPDLIGHGQDCLVPPDRVHSRVIRLTAISPPRSRRRH
jgi:uncharacterized radical SAM protein YgiQ